MAQDKKRDFTGFIVVGAVILVLTVIFTAGSYALRHGPEKIDSFYVQQHEQTVTEKIRDSLIDAIFAKYQIDNVCFDNFANVFLFHIPEYKVPGESNKWLDSGWYMESSYTFIQLQNKSYVIESFLYPVRVTPDLTGIYCRQQEIKNN